MNKIKYLEQIIDKMAGDQIQHNPVFIKDMSGPENVN